MRSNDAAASGRRLVETYYDAVDAGDYDRLASVLSPEFVHDRPDRTLSGRDAFVSFMREDRPETATRHDVTATYRAVDCEGRCPSGSRNAARSGDGDGWVARGRLIGPDGGVRFRFVDVFTVGEAPSGGGGEPRPDGGVRRIETFVRGDA